MDPVNRIFRAVLWGVVVTGGLLSFVRQLTEFGDREITHAESRATLSRGIRLCRDPVCGTYVSPQISFKLQQAGQVSHFCSAQCREHYGRLTARAGTR